MTKFKLTLKREFWPTLQIIMCVLSLAPTLALTPTPRSFILTLDSYSFGPKYGIEFMLNPRRIHIKIPHLTSSQPIQILSSASPSALYHTKFLPLILCDLKIYFLYICVWPWFKAIATVKLLPIWPLAISCRQSALSASPNCSWAQLIAPPLISHTCHSLSYHSNKTPEIISLYWGKFIFADNFGELRLWSINPLMVWGLRPGHPLG